MNNSKEKVINLWNTASDSVGYNIDRTDERIQAIIDNPSQEFHPTTWEVIKKAFPDLKGKKICVPSSGDNHAVFAFAELGAKVTSCDISQRQLANAKTIADKHNWDIEFILDDTMHLDKIKSNKYDFVYTSNGVHVWINDLDSMYQNIYRILKKSGAYIMYDIHPFARPFADKLGEIIIEKPYECTGPFDDGTKYHWRLQDIANAIASSGLIINRMEEMHDDRQIGSFWFKIGEKEKLSKQEVDKYYDWHTNPQAAFPQWLTICAGK